MFCPDCENFMVITDVLNNNNNNDNNNDNNNNNNNNNNNSELLSSDYDDIETDNELQTNVKKKKSMSSELKSEDIVKKAYYYCNNCGYNEIIKNNTIIFNTRSEQNDNVIVKQHYLNFKYDNTLPISKKYNCINNDCKTHKNPELKHAVFYRNKINKYNLIYVCSVCDSFWNI